VKQVGRELGVRYVLEGSVRKAGNRIRVTAQLIEAATSNHVWAERYDRDLADIFAMQDELTEALTTAMAPAIADAELRRAMRKPPGSLDAWAAYQRGLWHLSKAARDDDATAQEFFKEAIDLDPNFGGGYSALALTQLQAAAIYQSLDLATAQRSAETLARRAVALDGADAEARSCLGWALQARGEADGALAEIERALAMSPNLAIAHGHRGRKGDPTPNLDARFDNGNIKGHLRQPAQADSHRGSGETAADDDDCRHGTSHPVLFTEHEPSRISGTSARVTSGRHTTALLTRPRNCRCLMSASQSLDAVSYWSR
jgi:tetratricopeptide (TPR) repeat protein